MLDERFGPADMGLFVLSLGILWGFFIGGIVWGLML